MSFTVRHRFGEMEKDFPMERFAELLLELDAEDSEHPDIAVTHESDWSFSVSRKFFILENLDEGIPLHREVTGPSEALEMMEDVAQGRLAKLRKLAWRAGYPR